MTLQELYDWHVSQLTECDQQTHAASVKINDGRGSVETHLQRRRDLDALKLRAELHVNACKTLRKAIYG